MEVSKHGQIGNPHGNSHSLGGGGGGRDKAGFCFCFSTSLAMRNLVPPSLPLKTCVPPDHPCIHRSSVYTWTVWGDHPTQMIWGKASTSWIFEKHAGH